MKYTDILNEINLPHDYKITLKKKKMAPRDKSGSVQSLSLMKQKTFQAPLCPGLFIVVTIN